MNRLTDKQKAFCEQYIVDMNAKEAAVRVGYSAHTAKQQGHRLLTTPVCRAEIDRLLAERQQKTEYDRIRAEQELEHIHQRALEKGDLASAVAAVREKKKLFGLDQEEKTLNINVKPILSPSE